jgi:23S rRNA (cytidine1920-2'-O)/16S rRNA (cytidine1409-2'-O)-methyltransferase
MPKQRADELLVARGLAENRSQAQRLVMAGQVRAASQVVAKPSSLLEPEVDLQVDSGPRFVSRGGEKLAAALARFTIPVESRVCADLGASTGGFTDCLLQHGAAKVYAIDVGKGQLHWKLRQDPRVEVLEETNARYLDKLPEPVDVVTIDASFISLKTLLPVVRNWLAEEGTLLALIKPQFEAGKSQAGKGKGVIRDPQVHRQVLLEILKFAQDQHFNIRGLMRSPLLGPKGNAEFLLWAAKSPPKESDLGLFIEPLFGEDS